MAEFEARTFGRAVSADKGFDVGNSYRRMGSFYRDAELVAKAHVPVRQAI